MSAPLSNTGLPVTLNFEHYAGDSFRRYLILKNLDGSAFDADGYLFDFFIKQGSQKLYKLLNIEAVVTVDYTYLPLVKEGIVREGRFDYELKAKKSGILRTWLDGEFDVSSDESPFPADVDIITIDALLLEVEIEIVLEAPTGEVVEPPDQNGFPYSFPLLFA